MPEEEAETSVEFSRLFDYKLLRNDPMCPRVTLMHGCPENLDDLADSYLLGQLSPLECQYLEEHYLGCPRCTERIERTEEFIEALRSAAAPHPAAAALAQPAETLEVFDQP